MTVDIATPLVCKPGQRNPRPTPPRCPLLTYASRLRSGPWTGHADVERRLNDSRAGSYPSSSLLDVGVMRWTLLGLVLVVVVGAGEDASAASARSWRRRERSERP